MCYLLVERIGAIFLAYRQHEIGESGHWDFELNTTTHTEDREAAQLSLAQLDTVQRTA